jgi:restriction system protein
MPAIPGKVSTKYSKGPEFLRFCIPIIDVLKELGGSGTATEVTDRVVEKLKIPEDEQQETLKSGAPRVRNQVAWARLYLVKGGFLDSSKRGVWSLTEKGAEANLSYPDILVYFKAIQAPFVHQYSLRNKLRKQIQKNRSEIVESQEDLVEYADYKEELLQILRSLPPNGFERICQRLLRESGFQQVVVTGKSGDGGIDGHGILQVNPFVSFTVLFQCKRFQGALTPSQIRDFRGAMMGRADKGIVITTGTFTTDAKKEARRDGVSPIELVDGEKLVEMFELLEMGLTPTKTYEIDTNFFDEFKK